MKKIAFILAAIALMAFTLPKKYNLSFMLKEGVTYTQTMSIENIIDQTVQGQQVKMENTVTGITSLRLKEKTAEGATYTARYSALDISIEAMGQKQTFSSDTGSLSATDPMSSIMSGITNKDFVLDISKNGKVSNVSGLTEIMEEATVGLGDDMQSQQMREQLLGSMGNEGLVSNLEITTTVLPNEEVKPGSTWSKKMSSNSGFPLIIDADFTLDKVENGVAFISVKADVSTDMEQAKTNVQGMEAEYFFEGSRNGNLQVETETGWTVSGNYTDSIAGSIKINANAQLPDGMTVPVVAINSISISSTQE